jgi:hypothetical protein
MSAPVFQYGADGFLYIGERFILRVPPSPPRAAPEQHRKPAARPWLQDDGKAEIPLRCRRSTTSGASDGFESAGVAVKRPFNPP